MSESVFSPGIDPPSPTLSARLRELADYLAAPTAGRLTEEQRALSLGIARRMVTDVAARLDPAIDPAACAGTAQDDPGRDRGDPSSLGGGRSAPA